MRKKEPESFWQSYADLAMGLMAVFVLILIVQLSRATNDKELLEREREEFASELAEWIEQSEETVRRQDGAEKWLRAVFSEGNCKLELDATGALRIKGMGEVEAAGLYRKGDTSVDREAQSALQSCAENFHKLMRCLSPQADVASECISGSESAGAALALREGLEALVLQGNTDRTPLSERKPIIGAAGPLQQGRGSRDFTENAYLGAERARQALGHLLRTVEVHERERPGRPEESPFSMDGPTEIMMSRVRIESPSFGQYLAGPRDAHWRMADANGADQCRDDDCKEARNLSLKTRWKGSALRKPYRDMKAKLCAQLCNKNSALFRGLDSLHKKQSVLPDQSADGQTAKGGLAKRAPARSPEQVRDSLGCDAACPTER